MRILVTGSTGYVGSVLVPKLLDAGHRVTGVDLMWFWGRADERCDVRKGDFRELDGKYESGMWAPSDDYDAIIHLAAIANDPAGDLKPARTWETNALGTVQLLHWASGKPSIKKFIYASSGSVYGVCDWPEVHEGAPLKPMTAYNETKMVAERACLSYWHEMNVQVVRPATVCGMSPRMRLDVVVNMLTMQALTKGEIVVRGGKQMRPHIHIEDMTDLYVWLLESEFPSAMIWNAGFEDISVRALAEQIAERTGAKIINRKMRDKRSYRMNSDKLLLAGFKPKRTVSDAIDELIAAYNAGNLEDRPQWHTMKHMRTSLRAS